MQSFNSKTFGFVYILYLHSCMLYLIYLYMQYLGLFVLEGDMLIRQT